MTSPALSPAARAGLVEDVERAHMAVVEAERQLAAVVDEARRRGLLWLDVAAGLGVSKQAAHKRFRGSRVSYVDRELRG